MRDGIFPPGVHKKRTADIHHSQDGGKGWRRRGGRKSDGEEEIKEGTRDVVIQAWGCGLPGCLEDQTAGTKGDGEAMASRKCRLCGKSVCLRVKMAGVSMGTLLNVTACTEHADITFH